eukprot:scaffold583_cov176-Amphora_coffeaeformis.AAC.11
MLSLRCRFILCNNIIVKSRTSVDIVRREIASHAMLNIDPVAKESATAGSMTQLPSKRKILATTN